MIIVFTLPSAIVYIQSVWVIIVLLRAFLLRACFLTAIRLISYEKNTKRKISVERKRDCFYCDHQWWSNNSVCKIIHGSWSDLLFCFFYRPTAFILGFKSKIFLYKEVSPQFWLIAMDYSYEKNQEWDNNNSVQLSLIKTIQKSSVHTKK